MAHLIFNDQDPNNAARILHVLDNSAPQHLDVNNIVLAISFLIK